jgi:hypothetical protein
MRNRFSERPFYYSVNSYPISFVLSVFFRASPTLPSYVNLTLYLTFNFTLLHP